MFGSTFYDQGIGSRRRKCFFPGGTLQQDSAQQVLSADFIRCVNDALAGTATSGLRPPAIQAVTRLCDVAHQNGWTIEQFIVAVKTACHSSPEIMSLGTTSERDALLSLVVSACIKKYFSPDGKA